MNHRVTSLTRRRASRSMAYRRRRLRLVVLLLAVAGIVFLATARLSCGSDAQAAPAGVVQRGVTAKSVQAALPDDPFQRCAVKALRGDYGTLQEWQRVGYQRGLDLGARAVRAWVTTYFPEEGHHRGDLCRWGYGCSERVVAANRLPARTFVWANRTGIRQVLDTGARSNDTRADRLGADLWIDFWEPVRGSLWGDDNAGIQTVWIVPRRG